jgi:hypothetical protein
VGQAVCRGETRDFGRKSAVRYTPADDFVFRAATSGYIAASGKNCDVGAEIVIA